MYAASSSCTSGQAHRSQRSRISSAISRPLFRVVEQLAADEHTPDFGSARADLVQLGVTPKTPCRILVDVAVAAERLDCFAGKPRRFLRSVEDRPGRVLARRLPAV